MKKKLLGGILLVLLITIIFVNNTSAAECDCTPDDCANLTDISDYINNLVNAELQASANQGNSRLDQTRKLRNALGSLVSPVTNIEDKINNDGLGNPKAKDQSKYKDVGVTDGFAWLSNDVMSPCVLVCDQCIGADKLGHFFDQGFQFFTQWGKAIQNGHPEWRAWTEAQIWNVKTEFKLKGDPMSGMFGEQTTGVMSFADLWVNVTGGLFYIDLYKTPLNQNYTFNICDHVKPEWSEEINTNQYSSSVGEKVRALGRN